MFDYEENATAIKQIGAMVARKFRVSREDAEQEVALGFARAAASGRFNPALGNQFSTFASRGAYFQSEKYALAEIIFRQTHVAAEEYQHGRAHEYVEDLWPEAKEILTPKEYTILRLRLIEELPLSEVGEAVGYTKENVRLLFNRAIHKLRRHYDVTV